MAQCAGKTKSGNRCRRDAREGSEFCRVHSAQELAVAVEAQPAAEVEPLEVEAKTPTTRTSAVHIVMRRLKSGADVLGLGDAYPHNPTHSLLSMGWIKEVSRGTHVSVSAETAVDDDGTSYEIEGRYRVMLDDAPLVKRHTFTSAHAAEIAAKIAHALA